MLRALGASGRRPVGHIGRLLRPAKVRNAVRRRLFSREMALVPLCHGPELVHLGSEYGGWYVPARGIDPDWVCYCVGAGADISFDLALIDRYGCDVFAFDPSEASRTYVAEAAAHQERLHFEQVGVWPHDSVVRMFGPEDPEHVALSAANLQGTHSWIDVPCRSLPSLMAEYGHQRIDLLKLDLEGAEYQFFDEVDVAALGVQVLGVEFHHNRSAAAAGRSIEGLRTAGLTPVHRKGNSITFVREPQEGWASSSAAQK
jgi:FkbM family methyltransferase